MMEDLETELRRLPEPAAPTTLAAGVMARVTRMSESTDAPALRAAVGSSTRDLWAGVLVLAGVAVVGIAWISGGSELAPVFDPTSPPSDLLNVPSVGLWLTAGVLLYLAGLLAPVRRRLL